MSSHDHTRPGEMTDTQLDQLLAAANRELLGRIEATADPHGALTAIMTRSTQEAPSPQTAAPAVSHAPDQPWATVMITVRVRARDLEHDLDLACELTRTRDPARDLACELARTRDFARELGRTRELVRELIRDLARDLDLGRTRDLARDLADELDNAHARANGRALGRARDLGRNLALDLTRVIDGDGILARALDVRGALGLRSALDIRSGLGNALGLALGLASDLVSDLDAQQVDASGADLSDLEIRHLDVLDRIIWTRQTTWPPHIADQVETRSEEIRPGVYQIHFGNTSDRHALTPV